MVYHKTCVVDADGYFKFVDNDEEERTFVVSNFLDSYKVLNKSSLDQGKWNDWQNTSRMSSVIVEFIDDYYIFYDEELNNITEHVHDLT